jgi:hypothetical protein
MELLIYDENSSVDSIVGEGWIMEEVWGVGKILRISGMITLVIQMNHDGILIILQQTF